MSKNYVDYMVEETKKHSCDRQSIRLHKRGGRLCHGRIQKAWI